MASLRSGDMVSASQAWTEVSRAGAAAGSLYYELAGLNAVGWVLMYRGKLRQAVETFRHVLQRVASQQGQPALGGAHTGLGMVLREWNDLDGAEQGLLAGLEQVTWWGHLATLVLASLSLARIRQARSDAAGARELVVRAQEAVRRSSEERYAGIVAAGQVQLWLQQGHLAVAAHWAATVRLDLNPITEVQPRKQHIARMYSESVERRLLTDSPVLISPSAAISLLPFFYMIWLRSGHRPWNARVLHSHREPVFGSTPAEGTSSMNTTMRFSGKQVVLYGLLLLVLLWMLVPIIWMLLSSLKPANLIFSTTPMVVFIPTLEHYASVFTGGNNITSNLRSSILSAGISTIIAVVLGCFAGYGLSRIHFLGKQNLSFWIISTRMAPIAAVILPLYIGFRYIHLLNTMWGLPHLLAMKIALALGATQITMTDVSPQRLEMARKQGATRTVNVAQTPLANVGVEADVLIECSGNQKALMDGIRLLCPAGKAVAVGMSPGEEVSVPMSFLQNREFTLTGTFRYANTYADALALVATGHIDLEPIITGHYALEETEQALQATKNDPANIKSVVVPKHS